MENAEKERAESKNGVQDNNRQIVVLEDRMETTLKLKYEEKAEQKKQMRKREKEYE